RALPAPRRRGGRPRRAPPRPTGSRADRRSPSIRDSPERSVRRNRTCGESTAVAHRPSCGRSRPRGWRWFSAPPGARWRPGSPTSRTRCSRAAESLLHHHHRANVWSGGQLLDERHERCASHEVVGTNWPGVHELLAVLGIVEDGGQHIVVGVEGSPLAADAWKRGREQLAWPYSHWSVAPGNAIEHDRIDGSRRAAVVTQDVTADLAPEEPLPRPPQHPEDRPGHTRPGDRTAP